MLRFLVTLCLLGQVANAEDFFSPNLFSSSKESIVKAQPKMRCLIFTMDGCEPCKTFIKEIEQKLLPKGWEFNHHFNIIDVTDYYEHSKDWGVRSFDIKNGGVPQIAILRDDEVVMRIYATKLKNGKMKFIDAITLGNILNLLELSSP